MNTIKIFLAESGAIASLSKDFPLYQGAYNNKLLNIYVPVSILSDNLYTQYIDGTGFIHTEAGTFTALKIGMRYIQTDGRISKTNGFYVRYLKNVIYNNVEYALYERKLPSAFTVYSGEGNNAPTLIVNIVNMKNNNTVNTETGEVTLVDPTILEIITSQTCSLDVLPSASFDTDDVINPSEWEVVNGYINDLQSQINVLNNQFDVLNDNMLKTVTDYTYSKSVIDAKDKVNHDDIVVLQEDNSSLKTRMGTAETNIANRVVEKDWNDVDPINDPYRIGTIGKLTAFRNYATGGNDFTDSTLPEPAMPAITGRMENIAGGTDSYVVPELIATKKGFYQRVRHGLVIPDTVWAAHIAPIGQDVSASSIIINRGADNLTSTGTLQLYIGGAASKSNNYNYWIDLTGFNIYINSTLRTTGFDIRKVNIDNTNQTADIYFEYTLQAADVNHPTWSYPYTLPIVIQNPHNCQTSNDCHFVIYEHESDAPNLLPLPVIVPGTPDAGNVFRKIADMSDLSSKADLVDGKVPLDQIPASAITDTYVVASEEAMLALTAEVGDVAIRTDLNKTYILQSTPATTLANWKELLSPPAAVTSVAGKTGTVTLASTDLTDTAQIARLTDLTKANVGLGNVLNPTAYGGTLADNLNTIVYSGFYTCYGTATGAPNASSSWFVKHINSNTGTTSAMQIAHSYADNTIIYKRIKAINSWGTWARIDKLFVGLGNVDNTADVDKPVSTAQQTALDNKQDKNLSFTNTQVLTSAFVADSTYSALGYYYRAAIALTGVTSSDFALVTLSAVDSESGNYLALNETYAGGMYLYAKTAPTDNITIPTILVTKGA